MLDFFTSFAANLGIIIVLVVVLAKAKWVTVNLKLGAITLLLYFGYFLALGLGSSLIPIDNLFPDLNYNWGGKIASILLWMVTLFVLMRINSSYKAADMGFTLRQNQGSLVPAIVVTLLAIAVQVISSLALGWSNDPNLETFLYQATMPGFDEEPMFRGVILFLASLAIVSNRFNIFGAKINIAGLVLSLLFALVHGVMYSDGEWQFNMVSLAFSGVMGLILLWLRERTGSLLMPIIAHNLVNVVGQLM